MKRSIAIAQRSFDEMQFDSVNRVEQVVIPINIALLKFGFDSQIFVGFRTRTPGTPLSSRTQWLRS